MAGTEKKFNQYTNPGALQATDIFPFARSPYGSGTSFKTSMQNVADFIDSSLLDVGTGEVAFGYASGGVIGDSAFTYDSSGKILGVNNIRALAATIAGLNGSGTYENGSLSADLVLNNNPPYGSYTKLLLAFTSSGHKIVLADLTEPYSLRADEGACIFVSNESPTYSFQIQTFTGDIIYTLQPLETVILWVTDNTVGAYFVQNFPLPANLSYLGVGYHEINDGIGYVVPDPMPTVINVTDAGVGLSIKLPNMTSSTVLQANKSPNYFFIYNNYGGSSPVDVLKNDNSLLVSIGTGYGYMFTVKSNSSAAGDFIYEIVKFPAASSTKNGYLTSTDWNTFNNKQNGDVLGSGYLAQTVNTSPIQLSNPCPNFLVLDGVGPGPLLLPKMDDADSLTKGRNTFIFVKPAPTFTNPIAVYDFGGSNQQFILQPGVAYLGFVTSNGTAQGTFNWTKFNLDSIPVIRGTAAAITAITPSEETLGVATDTKQLMYYNMTAWVISA